MRKTLRRRAAAPLAALLLLISAVPAGDGGERGAEVRDRMRRLTAAAARQIVDQKPTRPERADAAMVAGLIIGNGDAGPAAPDLAMEYYTEAAELGSPEALCIMGTIYANGLDDPSLAIRQDMDKAREFYEKSAAAGFAGAMHLLGEIYADGRGIDPDPKRALSHFTEAAERGDEAALKRLEPIMLRAREWEAAKPERKGKANFPTTREDLVNQDLAGETRLRNVKLEKLRSEIYMELNRRVSEGMAEK